MHELTTICDTGLTITATLVAGAVVQADGVDMAEVAGVPGYYVGSVPQDTPAGNYAVLMLSAGQVVSAGTLAWDGQQEIDLATKTNELHLVHGLAAGKPLQVTQTARTAGHISQAIAGNAATTTIARQ